MNRETVSCAMCSAEVGEACVFPEGEPWTVVEDGEERRTVHAARYAEALPEDQRAAFWETAIDQYLARELAALEAGES